MAAALNASAGAAELLLTRGANAELTDTIVSAVCVAMPASTM
jgi:hypothetical protein